MLNDDDIPELLLGVSGDDEEHGECWFICLCCVKPCSNRDSQWCVDKLIRDGEGFKVQQQRDSLQCWM